MGFLFGTFRAHGALWDLLCPGKIPSEMNEPNPRFLVRLGPPFSHNSRKSFIPTKAPESQHGLGIFRMQLMSSDPSISIQAGLLTSLSWRQAGILEGTDFLGEGTIFPSQFHVYGFVPVQENQGKLPGLGSSSKPIPFVLFSWLSSLMEFHNCGAFFQRFFHGVAFPSLSMGTAGFIPGFPL